MMQNIMEQSLRRHTTMKISYDSAIDALYIRLIEGKHECRTVRLNEKIALNLGKGEKSVGANLVFALPRAPIGRSPGSPLQRRTHATENCYRQSSGR